MKSGHRSRGTPILLFRCFHAVTKWKVSLPQYSKRFVSATVQASYICCCYHSENSDGLKVGTREGLRQSIF